MKRMLILLLILASCDQNEYCDVDISFKNQFEEKIQFLIWTHTESDSDSTYQLSDQVKTIYFLESVTGIKSQIYWGDVFGYVDQKSLNEDLMKWRNWYNENKCKMTMVKADSLYRNYRR